jgi:hypothetical protein
MATPNPGQQQQQPRRIQGAANYSMSNEGRGMETSPLESGVGIPSLPGSPAMGTDLRDLPGFLEPGAPATPGMWQDPLDEAIGLADVTATPGAEPAPTSIDDLANESSGALYELLRDTILADGRDVAGEQEAMAAAMERAQRQSMVDARAGFGAMGGGASGALAGIEGDIASQGALDQALAMADLEERARQEQLQKIGSLTSAYGGLEKVSADQKELEILFGLLTEDDGAGTSGGDTGSLGNDVRDALQSDINLSGEPKGLSPQDALPPYVVEDFGWTRVGPSDTPGVSVWRDGTGAEYFVMDGGEEYTGDGAGRDISAVWGADR